MPTGKQLSFIHGELSPALRFKTNLAEYASGLAKLYNKIVRKAGGVSNRSGFRHMYTPTFQAGLSQLGRVKLFAAQLPLDTDETDVKTVIILMPSNTGETPEVYSTGNIVSGLSNNAANFTLTNTKVSQYKNTLVISNGEWSWAWYRVDTPDRIATNLMLGPAKVASSTPTCSVVSVAYAPTLGYLMQKPVVYAIYQVLKSGAEVLYHLETELTTHASGYIQPIEPYVGANAGCRNEVSILLDSDASVKHYNVYRATRDDTTGSSSVEIANWGLVGRIPKPASDRTVKFNDFIETPDFTVTPPDEDYLYGTIGRQLALSRRVGHYQQRRVVVPNPSYSNLDEGSVAVSNIGTPEMMDTGRVFTPTGAFDFKTPIGEQGRVLATLELERLVLFTESAVIVIQGGERGVLTPTEVNPKVVSRVGCSNLVHPISIGSRGFYVSRSGERVMLIEFDIDDTVRVIDISTRSDHLLEKAPIVDMTFTSGKEDILWCLHEDGTLLSCVITENGRNFGWSTHETNGFIESIVKLPWDKVWPVTTRERDNKTYESLAISVVRNGVRYIESLAPREDVTPEQKCYVDNAASFGTRLVYNRGAGYYEVEHTDAKNYQINITGGTLWNNTETLTLTDVDGNQVFSGLTSGVKIFFYYDDADGVQQTMTFTQTGYTNADVITGTVDKDVPAELRDATTLAASDMAERHTRWLFAYTSFNRASGNYNSNWANGVDLERFIGQSISVFADDVILSSPNNPNQPTLSIAASSSYEFAMMTTSQGLGNDNSFDIFITSNGIIYACTAGGFGISHDGGFNFVNRTTADGLGDNVCGAVALDSNDYIYVATFGGLSISTTAGGTFTNKTTSDGLGANDCNDVVVDSADDIYVGTSGGLSISTNGGTSFTNKTTAAGLGHNTVNGVFVDGNLDIYAATNGGISVSTNAGTSFTNYTTSNGLPSNTCYCSYVKANGDMYVGTISGLAFSSDGGTTFSYVTTTEGLGNNTVYDVHVDETTGYIYAATPAGLSISTDGGTSYTNYDSDEGHAGTAWIKGMYVDEANNGVYTASSYGCALFKKHATLTLPSAVAWGFVGLPYESEMETLDLDTADERTFTDSKKLINEVGIAFHETKGGFVGQTESGVTEPIDVNEMEEIISREDETFEEVTKNINQHISQDLPAHWERTGRVLIKQVDPAPMTVLAVYPKGVVGS